MHLHTAALDGAGSEAEAGRCIQGLIRKVVAPSDGDGCIILRGSWGQQRAIGLTGRGRSSWRLLVFALGGAIS